MAGELTCPRGNMPLSAHLEAGLRARFVERTAAPPVRGGNVRRGGRWYCPGCACRMVERDGSVVCERCGEYLDPHFHEIIELHSHGGTYDPETGEPRYDLFP